MSPKVPIKGFGNTVVKGDNNNVNITHYYKEPKIQKVVDDHQHNPDIHLTLEQQAKIREFVADVHEMMRDYTYKDEIISRDLYAMLLRKLHVPKYSLIPQTRFKETMQLLRAKRSVYRKRLMHADASRFKEYTIKFINIKWKTLRGDEDINHFASIKLNKKVTDIYKLSVNDLDILYSRVFALKK